MVVSSVSSSSPANAETSSGGGSVAEPRPASPNELGRASGAGLSQGSAVSVAEVPEAGSFGSARSVAGAPHGDPTAPGSSLLRLVEGGGRRLPGRLDLEEVDACEPVHEACRGPATPAELDRDLCDGATFRCCDDDLPVVTAEVHASTVLGEGAGRADDRVERGNDRRHLVGLAGAAPHLGDDRVDTEGPVGADPVHDAGLELEVTFGGAEKLDQRVVDDREDDRREAGRG